MANVVSIVFKAGGKAYDFDAGEHNITAGQKVVVETARGVECGDAVTNSREISGEVIGRELKPIIRPANEKDLARLEEIKKKETEAFTIALQKISARNLQMRLVRVEFSFDGSKILFCFTSDGRVDFRELVRDLAGVFHTRIELRQIGIRDEAKILGGLGICGRPFCCATFIGDFQPVSIKMAKEQGLSLNPVKISGTCGRLMCCLKYEQKAYEDLIRSTPRVGGKVKTPEGTGTIVDVALLTGKLMVQMDAAPEGAPRPFNKRDVTTLGGARFGDVEDIDLGELDEELIEELAAIADQPEEILEKAKPRASGRQNNRRGNSRPNNNNRAPGQQTAERPQGGGNNRGKYQKRPGQNRPKKNGPPPQN